MLRPCWEPWFGAVPLEGLPVSAIPTLLQARRPGVAQRGLGALCQAARSCARSTPCCPSSLQSVGSGSQVDPHRLRGCGSCRKRCLCRQQTCTSLLVGPRLAEQKQIVSGLCPFFSAGNVAKEDASSRRGAFFFHFLPNSIISLCIFKIQLLLAMLNMLNAAFSVATLCGYSVIVSE